MTLLSFFAVVKDCLLIFIFSSFPTVFKRYYIFAYYCEEVKCNLLRCQLYFLTFNFTQNHAFQLVISGFFGGITDHRFYNVERITDDFFGHAHVFIFQVGLLSTGWGGLKSTRLSKADNGVGLRVQKREFKRVIWQNQTVTRVPTCMSAFGILVF